MKGAFAIAALVAATASFQGADAFVGPSLKGTCWGGVVGLFLRVVVRVWSEPVVVLLSTPPVYVPPFARPTLSVLALSTLV